MARTSTGGFAIGFRRGWSKWQHEGGTAALSKWAKDNDFEALDLMNITPADLQTLAERGLRPGSVDLLDFGNLLNSDAGKRRELIERNTVYVKQLTQAGARNFFTCIIPCDPSAKRADNYRLAVETFAPIAEACASSGAAMVIEGWPGGPPWYANLCCTPETVRQFIRDTGGGAAVNYDPSHLIRVGVDHIRFLKEFSPHVKHVHAKDTQLNHDAMYEFGTLPAAFAKAHEFGEWIWRYTLPGHGEARWSEIFAILASDSYNGVVSIELEDENFNGKEETEQAALIQSRDFLKGA